MSPLALYLLGPPRLERDGEPVHVKRRKVMALLAYLAVTGQPHSRESLVTLLSPEFDTSRARNELRRTLSVLNRILGGGCLAVDRETVALAPAADPATGSASASTAEPPTEQALRLDVQQFQGRLALVQTHDHPSHTLCPDCLLLLNDAVALYHGDFMAGFNLPDSLAYEEWQFFQAEGLRNQLAAALG